MRSQEFASATLKQLQEEFDAATVKIDALAAAKVPEFAKVVYSHWGEDSIIEFVLKNVRAGRYLDIGCYHPALYSNTMKLYELGWTGVNIDPNPFMVAQFAQFRPKDISLHCGVGAVRGSMEFFQFHDWASSNTGSSEFARQVAAASNIPLPKSVTVDVVQLREVMETYFAGGAPDFMNVDVEEMDVDVLTSNDWDRYRPKVIAVEDLHYDFGRPLDSKIYGFLTSRGYELFSRCIFTSLFRDRRWLDS
jgi:FkbM family methyltransferase